MCDNVRQCAYALLLWTGCANGVYAAIDMSHLRCIGINAMARSGELCNSCQLHWPNRCIGGAHVTFARQYQIDTASTKVPTFSSSKHRITCTIASAHDGRLACMSNHVHGRWEAWACYISSTVGRYRHGLRCGCFPGTGCPGPLLWKHPWRSSRRVLHLQKPLIQQCLTSPAMSTYSIICRGLLKLKV